MLGSQILQRREAEFWNHFEVEERGSQDKKPIEKMRYKKPI